MLCGIVIKTRDLEEGGGIRLIRTAVALALLLSAAPPVRGDASYAPSAVVAADFSPVAAVVLWAPGFVPADSYRVYGITSAGGAQLLSEIQGPVPQEAWEVLVPSGFVNYGVSGVVEGLESPITLAVASDPPPPPCVQVYYPPLSYGISTECLDPIRNKVGGILQI